MPVATCRYGVRGGDRVLPALICAGLIVAQAAEQLGQQVLLRHFLVTVRGRTGYLEPQWEECSITGRAYGHLLVTNAKVCGGLLTELVFALAELMPLTYSQVGLDLTAHVDSPRSTRSGEWPRIFAITA